MGDNVNHVRRGRPRKVVGSNAESDKVSLRVSFNRNVYTKLVLVAAMNNKGVSDFCSEFVAKSMNAYVSKHEKDILSMLELDSAKRISGEAAELGETENSMN